MNLENCNGQEGGRRYKADEEDDGLEHPHGNVVGVAVGDLVKYRFLSKLSTDKQDNQHTADEHQEVGHQEV